MPRFLKFSLLALLALLILVPAASAQRGAGFGGRFSAGGRGGYGLGGYGRGGYGWGGYGYGYGWWPGLGLYYPYYGYPYSYGYGWGYPYAYGPTGSAGSVKILDAPKDVSVYVDGGYAGTVGTLKKFSLRSGSHDIELRAHSGAGSPAGAHTGYTGQDD